VSKRERLTGTRFLLMSRTNPTDIASLSLVFKWLEHEVD
jgi:hypothetical protein